MKSDWVQDVESHALSRVGKNFKTVADACESPIERAMFWAMVSVIDFPSAETWDNPGLMWFDSGFNGLVRMEPQLNWPFPDPKYRLDFGLSFDWDRKTYLLAVECDGHDFHERTKEQAAKDRARDRELLMAGVRTVRFTGSEIFKNPLDCARQVLDHLQSVMEEARRPDLEAFRKQFAERVGGLQ